jgi:hypothetical protein
MNMRWVIAALLFSGFGQAAQTDYFPLQVGNRWVLQSNSAELHTIEVLRSRTVNSNAYYLVAGYAPADVWIREAVDGTIYSLDAGGAGIETVLARLSPTAASYKTSLSGCEQTAQPSTSAGSLILAYKPDGCADIGITHEIYAAGVGLSQRAITTFRGEIVYDLVYAKVNGAPVLGRSREIVLVSDFSRGANGWLAGFTDYSLQIGDLRFEADLRPLPEEIDPNRTGFYLQSMNRSDDVFMFLKKAVTAADGLAPNQAYRVSFDIRFASNAATGCIGIGGSPGESVYMKAGAALDEPLAVLDPGGSIRLSADKGQQSTGGRDAAVIGDIGNGTRCTLTSPYVSVRRQFTAPNPIRTDSRGSLWLLLGTDSGFEGLTALYYQSIVVRVTPADAAQPFLVRRRR